MSVSSPKRKYNKRCISNTRRHTKHAVTPHKDGYINTMYAIRKQAVIWGVLFWLIITFVVLQLSRLGTDQQLDITQIHALSALNSVVTWQYQEVPVPEVLNRIADTKFHPNDPVVQAKLLRYFRHASTQQASDTAVFDYVIMEMEKYYQQLVELEGENPMNLNIPILGVQNVEAFLFDLPKVAGAIHLFFLLRFRAYVKYAPGYWVDKNNNKLKSVWYFDFVMPHLFIPIILLTYLIADFWQSHIGPLRYPILF